MARCKNVGPLNGNRGLRAFQGVTNSLQLGFATRCEAAALPCRRR
jgi:hypothetical protein